MMSRVSTRTSRSDVSATSAGARATDGFAAADGWSAAAGEAEALPTASTGAVTGEGVAPAPAAGLGTGFTTSACHVYRTRNARKMARRTRRSIYMIRLRPSLDQLRTVLRLSKDRTRPRGLGTGSCPAAHNGWHRARRFAASQIPRAAP